jgi:hypothetical protein
MNLPSFSSLVSGRAPAQSSAVVEFLARVEASRGRLIFAVDATASRQPTWDAASHLQREMFSTAASLEAQLVYFRGVECRASRWVANPAALADIMSRISCAAGHTQIGKVLKHTRQENVRQKVNALVLISDSCEEIPADLYNEARELGVPTFMFQEGTDSGIAEVYGEIAKLTNGASAKFDSSAVQRLGDLLRAVASYAGGGLKALAEQKTDAAKLLLTQIRN